MKKVINAIIYILAILVVLMTGYITKLIGEPMSWGMWIIFAISTGFIFGAVALKTMRS